MSLPASATPYDTDPAGALTAIEAHAGPVLLDLDETLYLQNSTEDFLDTARPALLALLLTRVLDVVKPWRWTGGDDTRDVWRVRLVSLFFPWVRRRWRARVGDLAARFANRPLIAAIKARHAPLVVATVGFDFIVEPLIAAMGLTDVRIVAARATTFADRRAGKYRLAATALGEDTVRSALVLTDSVQDLPLLHACGRPLRTVWPEARYRTAFSRAYLPGLYTSRVKRPGKSYILGGILQEDFAIWVFSSVAYAQRLVLAPIGLLFLLLSFWAVYERGYVDNDRIAARHEADPQLSDAFAEAPVATPTIQPWLWAAGAGAIGILILRWPAVAPARTYVLWGAALASVEALFYLYNRFDKATRVWLYAALQFARTTVFMIVTPAAPIGVAALGAHIVARWVPYYLYRATKNPWSSDLMYLTRLQFYLVLAALLWMVIGRDAVLNWTALALLALNVFQARRDLMSVFLSARRLDRAAS